VDKPEPSTGDAALIATSGVGVGGSVVRWERASDPEYVAALSEREGEKTLELTQSVFYFNLLWTWKRARVDYAKLLVWQKVNHFPDAKALTRKDYLAKHMARFAKSSFKFASQFQILPKTFVVPNDYMSFLEAFTEGAMTLRGRNLWILKPASSSRARGIRIISDLNQVDHHEAAVIQQYITDPLLVDSFKFDLRLYVLVTSVQPLEAFLFQEGFARYATTPFSIDPTNLSDRFVHLTNTEVQKDNPNSQRPEGTKSSLADLKAKLEIMGISYDALWLAIIRVVLKTLAMTEDHITPRVNAFELFGFDILVDAQLRPWLLEVNASPSLSLTTELDRQIKPRLLADIISLVDPLPFDRKALYALLNRRVGSGAWMPASSPGILSAPEKRQFFNDTLQTLLGGRKPRVRGMEPASLGQFQRIAPSVLWSQISKMKKVGFGEPKNSNRNHRQTFPIII
jgi:tubulin polyglutamylase TTLL5